LRISDLGEGVRGDGVINWAERIACDFSFDFVVEIQRSLLQLRLNRSICTLP
jgi:hypothetical protein